MKSFWQHVKTGDWLTAHRARAYSLILLALSVAAIVVWIALSHNMVDRNGKPLGTDFSSFYAAGSLVLDGRAAEVYNMAAHYAQQQQVFGAGTPYYGWLYPPLFLLIVTPLALMPYPFALAAWQVGTLLFYLCVTGLIVRDRNRKTLLWLLAAVAFPAVFVNLGHGQNGFLTAALLGAALLALPTRPLLSGLLFGLLAYKPQFALVIPVALLAASQWRTIAATTVTVATLVAVTISLFGIDLWSAFIESTQTSRKVLLEQGDVGFEKLQSVFAAIRLWDGAVPLAYVVQATVSIAVILSAAWVWRSKADNALKASILVTGTLLASPHVLDYDLVALAIAIAFFARHGLMRGFQAYEITLLAAAWAVPLFARSIAGLTGVPLGLLVMLALYMVTLHRAVNDLRRPEGKPGSSAADLHNGLNDLNQDFAQV